MEYYLAPTFVYFRRPSPVATSLMYARVSAPGGKYDVHSVFTIGSAEQRFRSRSNVLTFNANEN